jgi:cytochrome c-type biogenesis protein CcmH/NrfG
VAELLAKLQANPGDEATLQALGDEYFTAADFTTAATYYDRILAQDPTNVTAMLARGAVAYNVGDADQAGRLWHSVVALDAKNVEAHYDLGFLCLNQPTPDWACVEREWGTVVRLDPGSELARTVQSHLDALRAASMLPATPKP